MDKILNIMLESREDIVNKLNEYKDLLSEKKLDYNTINDILFFLSRYGFLAELRDAWIIYIDQFLKGKNEILFTEFIKSISVFPEDDEIFEKFINFINSINIKPEEKNIYIKTYVKLLSTVGKFGKAINIINEILNLDPDNVDNLILAASVYETEGHVDKAVTTYLKAIEKTKNIEEKIKLREQISIIDPANKENILELVDLYIQKKEYESASKILRNLLRYNQNDPEILYKIAEVDTLKNNLRGAIIAAKRVTEIDPFNPKYKYLLGYINFKMGQKMEAEKILSNIINDLFDNNYIQELKNSLEILISISTSYQEKYKDILKAIQEQEEQLTKISQQIEISQHDVPQETFLKNQEEKESKTQTVLEQQILSETLIQEQKIESIQEKEIPSKPKNLEDRETLSKPFKKSTGVFIRKDSFETKDLMGKTDLSKKTLLTKKENIFVKEGLISSKQSFTFKSSEDKQQKPFLEKKISDSSKTLLEKPLLEKKELSLEKREPYSVESKENQEEIKTTVILSKDKLLSEKLVIEKEKLIEEQEKIIEVEKDKFSTSETLKNIEIEMYENALLNILSNLNSVEQVIIHSLNLINNISQLSTNKFKLFVWISRILNIANIYSLVKIKEKLIEIIKNLGYEKSLDYFEHYPHRPENPLNHIFEELVFQENFEEIKDSLKEVLRYLINSNYIQNFIKVYKKLKEKYNTQQIDEIYIDTLNEEKDINFTYIFLNISGMEKIEYLSIENIENLINNLDYSSIIDNLNLKTKASLAVKVIEKGKLETFEKIIKKTSNIPLLLMEIYNYSKDKIIKINFEEIQDKNTKIIIYPLLINFYASQNKTGINDDIFNFYSSFLNDKEIKLILWFISYFQVSPYGTLIFINFPQLKKDLEDFIKIFQDKEIDNPLKKDLIKIIKLALNDSPIEEFNTYIDQILDKYDNSKEQFLLSLIQCWYNKNKNQEIFVKTLEKLTLIIDEINEKELLEFYKTLKQEN